jgi:glucose-1-phosphate thymidylyltransferase
VNVLPKGIIAVPDTTVWTGPWLGATRTPSLQRVANRPIVCHVLDAMRDAGITEVAVLSPSDAAAEIAECICDEGPADVKVEHFLSAGREENDDALLAATQFVGEEDICVIYRGNGLLGEPLLPYIEQLRGEGVDALLLIEDRGRGRGWDAKRLKLVSQSQRRAREHEDELSFADMGFAGVCLLGPGALARLEGHAWRTRLHDLTGLAEHLRGAGARVQTQVVRRWRHFAGDALDLLAMNRTMLDALDSETLADAGNGNRFEGPIEIHPTACVSSSVIIGPVIVGADALIADSYIGPHTSIAERVRIEGAELERSIVLADASVLHVGGRLVASIVGREARIFRDFSMPRAMRLQVGDGDEVALC